MTDSQTSVQTSRVYYFCRLRLPTVPLGYSAFEEHLQRAFALHQEQKAKNEQTTSWPAYVENLYALDLFLASACLDGISTAWEALFAARANRTDSLLVDALRKRAVRLYPRDDQKQDQAVSEFWGFLLVGEREGQVPILARYDGQRPLVPWLLLIFRNWCLSKLRKKKFTVPIDEDFDPPQETSSTGDERWHDEFRVAARDWLDGLAEKELLLLGLRLRYRMSQRDVASKLGIHEGNISRQIGKLRDHCQEKIGEHLRNVGWTGDDVTGFILKEMESLLLDEPRLSADRLAELLAARDSKGGTEKG